MKFEGSVINKNVIVNSFSKNPDRNFSQQIRTNADGKITHYLYAGRTVAIVGTTVPTPGTWYHIAIVGKNGGKARLYVNGVEEGTAQSVDNIETANNLYIGKSSGGAGLPATSHFNGMIDEVRIFNYVRSQAEIQAQKDKELTGTECGLITYFKFNQGVRNNTNTNETTLTDNGTNGYKGTLYNFALTGTTSNWIAGKTLGEATPYVDNIPPVKPVIPDFKAPRTATPNVPTTTDNCAGMVKGITTTKFPITKEGTTVITWTFTDNNKNSVTANQNIIIEDDAIPPVAPTLSNIESVKEVTPPTPTANDDRAGVIKGTTTTTFPITQTGTTVVTWTFDDGNGNKSTAKQNIIITPPKPASIMMWPVRDASKIK